MRRRTAHRLAPEESHSSRIAWWAAFVATVALIALLNFVRSAEAATLVASAAGSPSSPVLSTFEPEEEDEEGEGEEGAGEDEECEEVGGGELECFSAENEEAAPPECRLTSTVASAVLTPRGKLRLTVRYTAGAPVTVSIDSVLHGGRGSLALDGERKRFAGSGSLHETELLGPAQVAKAMAARTLMVTVRPLGAPRYCHAYFDQRLGAKRASARGPIRFS